MRNRGVISHGLLPDGEAAPLPVGRCRPHTAPFVSRSRLRVVAHTGHFTAGEDELQTQNEQLSASGNPGVGAFNAVCSDGHGARRRHMHHGEVRAAAWNSPSRQALSQARGQLSVRRVSQALLRAGTCRSAQLTGPQRAGSSSRTTTTQIPCHTIPTGAGLRASVERRGNHVGRVLKLSCLWLPCSAILWIQRTRCRRTSGCK